ncbi:hypothetical protein CPT_Moabite_284 [Serratia phage Moabite]|uniref:Uncharacterized protein n=3 Tax=Moabitevirus TaxID=2843422 RepID=A0A7T3TLX9_9CAUD|nr:hypothetical protein HWB23_gp214 [Serratia phage vB_SmaM_ 2050HW]YP_009849378.1 hypothetical protein HWC48_gp132 [Serratia phage Moabite]QPX76870.1 hypothetical protein [Serratia phage vB_SmaM_Yaphecito]UCR74805.1 hypothetical protein [Serratia phage BUCT660]UGO54167.1 hypothetical protein HAYMO_185 [Serratia phage vB_SmaM_Haymo]URG14066.1 hypothetical protein [Pectobacterium phage vB_ParM-25]ATA65549.1 hypothetical protein 2050HW_00214 [Serratia phage vB_SmaM_ 2050HW]
MNSKENFISWINSIVTAAVIALPVLISMILLLYFSTGGEVY